MAVIYSSSLTCGAGKLLGGLTIVMAPARLITGSVGGDGGMEGWRDGGREGWRDGGRE